ncbi:MAG: LytTR family DNA-binding domain-containing protein [Saprospiraceae bacterium]
MNQQTTYFLPLLKGNFIAMSADEIKYIRSDGPVVLITDIQDQQLASGQSLKFYSELLSDVSFFQVSQSMLVNLQKVRYIDAGNQELELICGKRITISRNGLKLLKDHLKSNGYKW